MPVSTHGRSAPPAASSAPGAQQRNRWWTVPFWNRFTALQMVVMALAAISPLVILGALVAGALGLASTSDVQELALQAGEDPGMLVFGAMFLASPVQWCTGRSQVRVRKFLGIVFFILGLSNGAMFLWQEGAGHLFSRPLVVAGMVALAVATPLFLTSSRASQRVLGMRRWRLLHKLTYVVAAALLLHVALIPDFGPGALLILAGFVARIPAVRRRIVLAHESKRGSAQFAERPSR